MTTVYVLYRLYAADDRLIYVGRTVRLTTRLLAHQRQGWDPPAATVEIEGYATVDDVLIREAKLILAHRPLFNRQLLTGADGRCSLYASDPREPSALFRSDRRPVRDAYALHRQYVRGETFQLICQGCGREYTAWSKQGRFCWQCNRDHANAYARRYQARRRAAYSRGAA